ncbi:hypothetical protein I5U03_11955 [Stenotrophomonas maltophilia]|uniref:hypothetical protein n=1 Tax=Stenotrophomonas maltophilia TaxID=40324 RepID=UPI001313444F|nr:hypothetical protein [Stenotrophomonas maltophilia]MBH1457357.1 hypothetical protein [Stenotrophomonas maltophilia]MBH1538191.1 hypothetical protein [Stenotrophomonas maltophilia]MBH1782422.1 hypothetical protein [Stenotrophomonas maltophilia]MBN5045194.1 hypothetical protein [Stenotrophomonas maltophilia]MBN5154054.1 hypothetical protein [Stenotrophomonas maltophilia]
MVETVLGMTDLQIRLFTAIGQILVAAAVGVIAWRQWRTAQQQAETARKKLIADLFDRRFKAYDKFVDHISNAFYGDKDEVKNAEKAVADAHALLHEIRWLFGEDVTTKLRKQIIEPVERLVSVRGRLSAANGPDYIALVEEYRNLRKKADIASAHIASLFDAHLTLRS